MGLVGVLVPQHGRQAVAGAQRVGMLGAQGVHPQLQQPSLHLRRLRQLALPLQQTGQLVASTDLSTFGHLRPSFVVVSP